MHTSNNRKKKLISLNYTEKGNNYLHFVDRKFEYNLNPT